MLRLASRARARFWGKLDVCGFPFFFSYHSYFSLSVRGQERENSTNSPQASSSSMASQGTWRRKSPRRSNGQPLHASHKKPASRAFLSFDIPSFRPVSFIYLFLPYYPIPGQAVDSPCLLKYVRMKKGNKGLKKHSHAADLANPLFSCIGMKF